MLVGGRAATATTGGIQAQLLAIQSFTSQIRRELQELRTNHMADRVFVRKNFHIVNFEYQENCFATRSRGWNGDSRMGQ